MKIAIIGAGLSGLAAAHYLLESGLCSVDLFDEKGVGAGASGIASGLVHPYPGEEARRSLHASEALRAVEELFARAGETPRKGIMRIPRTQEERERLRASLLSHGDVEEMEEGFLIKSGMTIHTQSYLEKLWGLCSARGAKLYLRRINALDDLAEYDQIVLATGASTPDFSACKDLRVQKLKGQVLLCTYPDAFTPFERSLIGKGYIALGEGLRSCVLGSTYERNFTTDAPDIKKAKEEILTKIGAFFPKASELVVQGCRAAVRLARRGHYLPYVRKMGKKSWVIAAMGSRGLLYHAFAGKMLAQAILAGDEKMLLPEFS